MFKEWSSKRTESWSPFNTSQSLQNMAVLGVQIRDLFVLITSLPKKLAVPAGSWSFWKVMGMDTPGVHGRKAATWCSKQNN